MLVLLANFIGQTPRLPCTSPPSACLPAPLQVRLGEGGSEPPKETTF